MNFIKYVYTNIIRFVQKYRIAIVLLLAIAWLLSKLISFIPSEVGTIVEGFAIAITLFGVLNLQVDLKKYREEVEKMNEKNYPPSKIFIHNAKGDIECAKTVKDYIKEADNFVQADKLEIRLLNCKAIILIYSDTKYRLWVKKRIESYKRIEVINNIKITDKLIILTKHKEEVEQLTDNKVKIVNLGSEQWNKDLKSTIENYLKT